MPCGELSKRTLVFIVCVFLGVAGVRCQSQLAVKNLRCEYETDPVGIDVKMPRFSWQLESTERGVLQKSYEIRVAASEQELAKGRAPDLLRIHTVDVDSLSGVRDGRRRPMVRRALRRRGSGDGQRCSVLTCAGDGPPGPWPRHRWDAVSGSSGREP